jgi:hypothetical protein
MTPPVLGEADGVLGVAAIEWTDGKATVGRLWGAGGVGGDRRARLQQTAANVGTLLG